MMNGDHSKLEKVRFSLAPLKTIAWYFGFLVALPTALAFFLLGLWFWDLSLPLNYGDPGADEVWQYGMIRTLIDTGWVLDAPRLGAPGEGHFYNFTASQLSALHQVPLKFISLFTSDPVLIYNIYFLSSFSLTTISVFACSRILGSNRATGVAAGLLIAFLFYRIMMSWSYSLGFFPFIAPTILLSVFILTNRFQFEWVGDTRFRDAVGRFDLGALFKGISLNQPKAFSLAILTTVLASLCDGYFTFFLLLLFAFSIGIAALLTPPKAWGQALIAPLILLAVAGLTYKASLIPLEQARISEPNMFLQDEEKNSFEAEVYSSPLKHLVAPSAGHRIPAFSEFGRKLVDDTNRTVVFPNPGAVAPFGLLGSVLLGGMLLYLFLVSRILETSDSARSAEKVSLPENSWLAPQTRAHLWALAILSVFILLLVIRGGLGSILSTLVPAIRAYERYPIYISVSAMMFGAVLATSYMDRLTGGLRQMLAISVVAGVTLLALLDQTTSNPFGMATAEGRDAKSERYLLERDFIQGLEDTLPEGAMIYNFPYSQYLSANKYYGWGKFGHYRPYIFSQDLRWSNGANLHTDEDRFHRHLAVQSFDETIRSLQRIGFDGILVDRLVLEDADFDALHTKLVALTGAQPVLLSPDSFHYYALPKVPVRVDYRSDFRALTSITLESGFEHPELLEFLVNPNELARLVGPFPLTSSRTIQPEAYPSVFLDISGRFDQLGQEPLAEFRGDTNCSNYRKHSDTVTVSIEVINDGTKDLPLNSGYRLPITLGVNEYGSDDTILNSGRISETALVSPGETEVIPYSFKLQPATKYVRIELLQEGVAWFHSNPENTACLIDFRAMPG